MSQSKLHNPQMDLLMNALLHLKSEDQAYRFFEDLCTVAELRSMAQRLHVAVMLRKGETYQEIAGKTGASTATISRVNRCLLYGQDGYAEVLQSLEETGYLQDIESREVDKT